VICTWFCPKRWRRSTGFLGFAQTQKNNTAVKKNKHFILAVVGSYLYLSNSISSLFLSLSPSQNDNVEGSKSKCKSKCKIVSDGICSKEQKEIRVPRGNWLYRPSTVPRERTTNRPSLRTIQRIAGMSTSFLSLSLHPPVCSLHCFPHLSTFLVHPLTFIKYVVLRFSTLSASWFLLTMMIYFVLGFKGFEQSLYNPTIE